MDDNKLREIAKQAGFKVWADGRITAADDGVSGSATKSLAEFARRLLAEDQAGRDQVLEQRDMLYAEHEVAARRIDDLENDLVAKSLLVIDLTNRCTRANYGIDQLQQRIVDLEREVAHWKNNHATEVRRARTLKERTDMPLERVQAYEKWGEDQAALAEAVTVMRGVCKALADFQQWGDCDLDWYDRAMKIIGKEV